MNTAKDWTPGFFKPFVLILVLALGLVSEWMGFYLLHESMLNSVIAARDRHLSDDGIVLPSHARIVSLGLITTDS